MTQDTPISEDSITAESEYQRVPICGLPRSLLAPAGNSIELFSLLQTYGLNRDLKRKLADHPVSHIDIASETLLGDLPPGMSEIDHKLLRQWANPVTRYARFWTRNKRERNGPLRLASSAYAMAIDFVLLDALDPDWKAFSFDEASMCAACPVWPSIHANLMKSFASTGAHLNLGVFMLWPRLLDELSRWQALDEQRRVVIGRAVFSMSSITMSDWFARRAVELCPDLESEFMFPEIDVAAPTEATGDAATEPPRSQTGWDDLLQRLDAVSVELHSHPTQQAVAELKALADAFAELADTLPKGGKSDREQCLDKIAAVLDECRRLEGDSDFSWLDAGLIEQIEARWQLALAKAGEALDAIRLDVEAAPARMGEAAQRVRATTLDRAAVEAELAAIDEQLSVTKPIGERRPIEQQRLRTLKEQVDIDEQLPGLQDMLLAASSPFGEAFNHEVDYRVELNGLTKSGVTPEEPPAGITPVPAPVEVAPPNSVQAAEPDELPQGDEPTTGQVAEERMPAPVQRPAEKTDDIQISTFEKPQVLPPVTTEARDADMELDVYSPQAGEACRQIWKLLADGRLSAACHLVKAMSTQPDAPQMPPTELLEALVFADALIYPDGGLHDAVAARLQEFSEDWFHEQEPRSWYTALNLLLVASTLRPMVLAPDSGASVIAGYLHIDSQGRYASLWRLVQSLRDASDRLRGFRIDLASLHSAGDHAEISREQQKLQHEAQDWLKNQAPAITIKFAPATKVWHAWLRPNGVIHRLVSPVAENRAAAAEQVEPLIKELSDSSHFLKLVKKTDRTDNGRRKGDDIHAGALDHLGRCTAEALSLARRWLPSVAVRAQSTDRMHELLLGMRKEIEQLLPPVRAEMAQPDTGKWQLVASAQRVALNELEALHGLFDPASPLPSFEPKPAEALARDLLQIPEIRIAPDWKIETPSSDVATAIRNWAEDPMSVEDAFEARLDTGDVFGAELLADLHNVEMGDEAGAKDQLRRERESWRAKLGGWIKEARRDIEVGSAYGYVTDAERNQWEGDLVRIESLTEENHRFDSALASITNIRNVVRTNRDDTASFIERAIGELQRDGKNEQDVQAVRVSLDEGDMATANELLQRVRRGLPAWPEDAESSDSFSLFATSMNEIEAWISKRSPDDIKTAIKNGSIPGIGQARAAGAQRDEAASMFAAWLSLKSRQTGDSAKLREFFSALGFIVTKPPSRQEGSSGKEFWLLSTQPISDRSVCPVPHFGSAAKGTYRVICLWGRPTEDDIVQVIGETNLHRATVVLYFGRMTERKWRDLSRKTKLARKSFLLIDELILLFLAGQSGSRLAALFATALPFSYSDPFDATAGFVAPEMFYGRETERDAVLGLNGRCFIYGGRQLGKTALLRRAEQTFHAPERNHYSHYLDLRAEGIGVNRGADEMWQTIAAALKSIGVLSETPSVAELAKKSGVNTLLNNIQSFLDKDDTRRILLLLDEADRFFEQDGRHDFAETRRLKQLMDKTQRRFKVIFAGLHNVLRMTERANHPLAHFGQPIKIGPFIEEHEIREARELIRRPLAAAGFEFESPSLIIRILAQTNYYPSLIQLYCNHLLHHMLRRLGTSQKLAGPRYRITGQDIEAVYSSSDLRGEIRAKFNFTLQLDSRYEVVAYGMAYEMLTGRFNHGEGMDWRAIWHDCAMKWWPDGVRDTSELDFRVLLDEMVELGVLSRPASGRYALRNPNIFLLLGNRDEVETVLVRSREPAVEFDSATFHPQLRNQRDTWLRHPLTYQQLSEIQRHGNGITVVTGTVAAGIDELAQCLKDSVVHSGTGAFHEINACDDHHSFGAQLKELLDAREKKDGLTVIVVPHTAPWSGLWIKEAHTLISALRSTRRFVSLCFLADPATLWGVISDDALTNFNIPWISLFPWRESFVRQYLEDLQLSAPTELIGNATGYWPHLLYPIVANCSQVSELSRRAKASLETVVDSAALTQYLEDFGLNTQASVWKVLGTLAELRQSIDLHELGELAEFPVEDVRRVVEWGALLGLVDQEASDYWSLDPTVGRILLAAQSQ